MHETIHSAIELNKVLCVAFLDIRKAFDTVNHRMLFYKLDVLRIPKQISNIIRQAYIGMKSIVMINGVQSKPFDIKRGVRQGGVLSSLLFLIFIDGLLRELEQRGFDTVVCDLQAGNPTLADDLTLIAMTPMLLQKMLSIVECYVNKWLLTISNTKSFIMIVSPSKKFTSCNFLWKINSHPLEITTKVTHPLTSLKLYKSVILPAFLYGCGVWNNMRTSTLKSIEMLHHYCLKRYNFCQ